MNIETIMNFLKEILKGRNVRVQIQLDGVLYYWESGVVPDNPVILGSQDPGISRSFLDWMLEQINTQTLKDSTRSNHLDSLRILRNYDPNLSFGNLSRKTVRGYYEYLVSQGYSKNTVVKHMKIFHRYVGLALSDEILTSDPFQGYRNHYEATKKNYLTTSEVSQVHQELQNLSDPFEIETIRGFLFSCYTGLRYSDIKAVEKSWFHQIDNVIWMVFKAIKTGSEVHVPVSEIFGGAAMTLLDLSRDRQFPVPANDVANRSLRRVLGRLGITRDFTFHCGRVSCAHNLLSLGVPITSVQHILGHASVTTTEGYVKFSDDILLNNIRTK